MSPFQLGWRETRAGKESPEKTNGKAARREWSGPESSEDTGAQCALALALQCGGRGLLFRPIERTHSEKGVIGEGNHLVNELAVFNEGWRAKKSYKRSVLEGGGEGGFDNSLVSEPRIG